MDYTKFLGKKEEAVLPYLGGAHVHGKDRRLRVDEPRPALGFHRFEISGRKARWVAAAEPEASVFGGLPKGRGHHVAGFLVHDTHVVRLALLPEEELPALAVVRARKWPSGDWLYETTDFDGDVEEAARIRLEQRAALGDLKGAAATLRVAYGLALGLETARRLDVPFSVREAAPHAVGIAEGGASVVERLLAELVRERREAEARALRLEQDLRERERIRAMMANREAARNARIRAATSDNARDRAEVALEDAGADMTGARRLADDRLEVTFNYLGERFVSVVDSISLQVLDAGICLSGEDRLVTLESLPGVIREAIDTERLVITRR